MSKPIKTRTKILRTVAALAVVYFTYSYWVHIRYNGDVEDVAFQTGDVTLRGWFVSPEGPGPFPAVVILHGAGSWTGDSFPERVITNAFLRSGVAVLAYGKRGVGRSGGRFVRNAYRDFIEDGVSAVRYLKTRSDVLEAGIGLVGSSEGGWFTAEIAHRTGDVSFIINRAGSALPWVDTELWETRHDLLRDEVDGEALEQALHALGQALRFIVEVEADPSLVEGERWRDVEAELAEHNRRHAGTKAALRMQKLPEYQPESYATAAQFMAYDPQPFIEQISIPMLYVFAENDQNIPTARSVEYLRSLQQQEGKHIEVIVIPGVEHGMLSPAGFLSCGVHPAFLDAIGPWAAAQAR
jgi:dipeptidyl aminopeptidase/acylaminoacyl peptidase